MFAYAGKRQEVHASPWSAETKGHWVNFHVKTTHVCDLPVRGQECLQRFQGNHCCSLVHCKQLNISNVQTLDLSCETQDDVDSWKASFLRAGVYPEKSNAEGTSGGEGEVSHSHNILCTLLQHHFGQKYIFSFFQFKICFFPSFFKESVRFARCKK